MVRSIARATTFSASPTSPTAWCRSPGTSATTAPSPPETPKPRWHYSRMANVQELVGTWNPGAYGGLQSMAGAGFPRRGEFLPPVDRIHTLAGFYSLDASSGAHRGNTTNRRGDVHQVISTAHLVISTEAEKSGARVSHPHVILTPTPRSSPSPRPGNPPCKARSYTHTPDRTSGE